MAAPFEPSPGAQHATAAKGTAMSDGACRQGRALWRRGCGCAPAPRWYGTALLPVQPERTGA
eukprot:7387729-Prymnesium_polylepis.2